VKGISFAPIPNGQKFPNEIFPLDLNIFLFLPKEAMSHHENYIKIILKKTYFLFRTCKSIEN
jgi:hypothetical protein